MTGFTTVQERPPLAHPGLGRSTCSHPNLSAMSLSSWLLLFTKPKGEGSLQWCLVGRATIPTFFWPTITTLRRAVWLPYFWREVARSCGRSGHLSLAVRAIPLPMTAPLEVKMPFVVIQTASTPPSSMRVKTLPFTSFILLLSC